MSSYEQIVEEMKSKRKNEWAPRGRGKQISDEKLVYEYSVLKKSVNRIAKENGWVTNTLKQRLVRLGVYVRGGQGEVKRLPKRERNSIENSVVENGVRFEELSDEEKRARREESKRRYEEMKRNGLV